MRRFFCILLLLCLPLQGFAMQWGMAWASDAAPPAQEVVHEVMHEEHISHHHEEDGTLHVDDSEESVQHVQDHSVPPQPVTLTASLAPIAPPELVSPVVAERVQIIPDPMLECPHRPPAGSLG